MATTDAGMAVIIVAPLRRPQSARPNADNAGWRVSTFRRCLSFLVFRKGRYTMVKLGNGEDECLDESIHCLLSAEEIQNHRRWRQAMVSGRMTKQILPPKRQRLGSTALVIFHWMTRHKRQRVQEQKPLSRPLSGIYKEETSVPGEQSRQV